MLLGWWLRRQRDRTILRIKIEGVRFYLKALRATRLSVIGFVMVLFTLQLMAFGFALMLGAGIYLSPLPEETKLWIAFGVGSTLFVVPFVLLAIFLSERLWYEASGARKMVDETLEKGAA